MKLLHGFAPPTYLVKTERAFYWDQSFLVQINRGRLMNIWMWFHSLLYFKITTYRGIGIYRGNQILRDFNCVSKVEKRDYLTVISHMEKNNLEFSGEGRPELTGSLFYEQSSFLDWFLFTCTCNQQPAKNNKKNTTCANKLETGIRKRKKKQAGDLRNLCKVSPKKSQFPFLGTYTY